jgi:hypothetical protein
MRRGEHRWRNCGEKGAPGDKRCGVAMVQHVIVTLSIALARPSGYRVVYAIRYAKANAASGFMIPQQAQLQAFLQHFALAPEAIAQLLTKVHAGSTEQRTLGAIDHDHAERILRCYAQW